MSRLLLSWKSIGLNLLRLNLFLCSANVLCWIVFGGFICLCPDSWPFENFSLRKIFCASFLVSLTWGWAGFFFFFERHVIPKRSRCRLLSQNKTRARRRLQLKSIVSSETSHPGYFKNLVLARWNSFQRYVLYRVIDSCQVEFCFAETVRNEMISTIHTLSQEQWCTYLPVPGEAWPQNLSLSLKGESWTSTDFRRAFIFLLPLPSGTRGCYVSWVMSPWTTGSPDKLRVAARRHLSRKQNLAPSLIGNLRTFAHAIRSRSESIAAKMGRRQRVKPRKKLWRKKGRSLRVEKSCVWRPRLRPHLHTVQQTPYFKL